MLKIVEHGRLWSDEGTRAFLEIWGQDRIQRQLSGLLRNDDVFGRIVEELRRRGFSSHHSRMSRKVEGAQEEIVDRSRRSGAGNKSDADGDGPVNFPYFTAIDAVMSGRASVSPVALLDSSYKDNEVAY